MKTTLLNPFSVSLKKDPFMQVHGPPVYISGFFRIYKTPMSFVHTFKNVVIAERVGANKQLIQNLSEDIKPKGAASLYHDYERPKAAMLEGIEAAKNLNFIIQ